jgi:hypothetical protein
MGVGIVQHFILPTSIYLTARDYIRLRRQVPTVNQTMRFRDYRRVSSMCVCLASAYCDTCVCIPNIVAIAATITSVISIFLAIEL